MVEFELRDSKQVFVIMNNSLNYYRALDVAKYIIKRCYTIGEHINNLKLQKILYFVQARFIVQLKRPCFLDRMEAWDYGPVVPIVYDKYHMYGRSDIPSEEGVGNYSDFFSSQDMDVLNDIIDQAARKSPEELVSISHTHAPWINAYKNEFDHEITPESIKNYFDNSKSDS